MTKAAIAIGADMAKLSNVQDCGGNTTEIGKFRSVSVHVYPNPTRELINLSGDFENGAVYQLNDSYGRLIQSGRLSGQLGQIRFKEDLSGTYHLFVRTVNGVAVKPVIIQ